MKYDTNVKRTYVFEFVGYRDRFWQTFISYYVERTNTNTYTVMSNGSRDRSHVKYQRRMMFRLFVIRESAYSQTNWTYCSTAVLMNMITTTYFTLWMSQLYTEMCVNESPEFETMRSLYRNFARIYFYVIRNISRTFITLKVKRQWMLKTKKSTRLASY